MYKPVADHSLIIINLISIKWTRKEQRSGDTFIKHHFIYRVVGTELATLAVKFIITYQSIITLFISIYLSG